ncbi:glycosyltransferase family 4 protein [Candidatus Leptofilum sp.]|uniref:glycosyltransferase family 4 protein n=1 Tax=Candidatus Leptofilum sp. TaxID=3241576 RepID=UPI003B58F99B
MRLAIITPRYGPEVLGGAETFARNLAEQLAAHSHEVHVWTSCAKAYYLWENVYPAGTTTDNRVTVRRFPITSYNAPHFVELSQRLEQQWGLGWPQQKAWLAAGAHSQPLYEALSQEASSYDALLVLPYQAILAQTAAWIAPERTILIPCLHNESYAYLDLFRLLLAGAFGVLFLTPEEQAFTNNQLKANLKRQAILGAAVSEQAAPITRNPANPPYLLTLGRLEAGKNVALLYDYVQRLADSGSPIKLVLAGEGPFPPPAQPPFELRGFVSEEEKRMLLAGATALVQPSLNESFSLVLLESWLAGCPVLVHKKCPVTSGHVRRSQGGLAFATYGEFATAARLLLAEPKKAREMGENGRTYTHQNYTWPRIISRLENILENWLTN